MEHLENYLEKTPKEKEELQKKYPLLGKKVRRRDNGCKWEEGIIVLGTAEWSDSQPEIY